MGTASITPVIPGKPSNTRIRNQSCLCYSLQISLFLSYRQHLAADNSPETRSNAAKSPFLVSSGTITTRISKAPRNGGKPRIRTGRHQQLGAVVRTKTVHQTPQHILQDMQLRPVLFAVLLKIHIALDSLYWTIYTDPIDGTPSAGVKLFAHTHFLSMTQPVNSHKTRYLYLAVRKRKTMTPEVIPYIEIKNVEILIQLCRT